MGFIEKNGRGEHTYRDGIMMMCSVNHPVFKNIELARGSRRRRLYNMCSACIGEYC